MSFPKKNRVIVEGVNFRKRASRPTQENPSGVLLKEKPHCTFLMLWLLIMVRPTRVGYKVLDDGTKIRISKKTEEEIQF